MKKLTLFISFMCILSTTYGSTTYLVQLGTTGAATWRAAGTGETLVDLSVQAKTLTAWLTATTFVAGDAVWLASGTYTVTTAYLFPTPGLSIYGGFSGNETSVTGRLKGPSGLSWDFTNQSIITGTNNTTQIFTPGSARAGSFLDGLTITKAGSGANAAVVLRDGITVRNCQFTSNVSTGNSGAIIMNGGGTVNSCLFQSNSALYGAGIFASAGPGFTFTVSNCVFDQNNSTSKGGGMYISATGTVNVTNCTFKNNSATTNGAALYITLAAATNNTTVTNCLLYGNTTKEAIYMIGGTLYNCTIVNNTFGGAYLASATIPSKIYNSVFWGTDTSSGYINSIASNTASIIQNTAYTSVSGNITTGITYSLVLPKSNTGTGAPYFTDPTNNWQHSAGSSLIDAGSSILGTAPATDLIGTARPQGSAYDIGAYENPITVKTDTYISTLSTTLATDVIVSSGVLLTIDANSTIHNLIINGGGKVTNTNKSLIVNNFTINSDATNGTGTYVDNGTTNVSGTASVQQYTDTIRNWYISIPVSTYTPAETVYEYYEPNNTWSSPSILKADSGYIIKPGVVGTKITFSGTLNNGNQSATLTRSATNTLKPGFNLVGNPYPSYVNARTAVNNATNLEKTIWYRTTKPGYNKTYVFETFNTVSGLIGTNLSGRGGVLGTIPPMQSFWVRVKEGETTATLNFTNTLRSHFIQTADTTSNPLRVKTTNNATQQVLRLQVSNGIYHDEAIVYFNANASNGYDNYDSQKMTNGNAAIPEIYTMVGNKELVFNGMNTIPYDVEIPLYFNHNASSAGTFSLSSNEMSNFETGTKVYVKNNKTGEQQIISDGTVYTFDATAVESNPAFSLIFKAQGGITVVPTAATDQNLLVYRNANNQIAVQIKGQLNVAYTLDVYNSVGQKLASKQATAGIIILDAPQSGVYFVTIKGNGNNTTKKVIIN